MTSQPGKQTITIHILPSISRSKGNQTMKFGQLIEYKIRNIFHGTLYIKEHYNTQSVVEKLFAGPFSNNQN